MTTSEILKTLECLILKDCGSIASFYNLDIKCPEMDEVKERFKTSVKYHMLLSNSEQFSCSIDSSVLCNIESFVKQNPCTCTSCTASCPNFDITDVDLLNVSTNTCNSFHITEL